MHHGYIAEAKKVWVYALDGATVGRFSKRFGLESPSS